MSTNISKKKRDDLLDKIKQIRAFIAAAPQDENTGNLLSYLSELEKDVNGKKYGLVFEEHREEIDEVLDTHTPVLTEDADLFIDHGVQMNFLIEGDNLASLQLLEKTHKGKIDLMQRKTWVLGQTKKRIGHAYRLPDIFFGMMWCAILFLVKPLRSIFLLRI